ncbi:hypothetical protein CQY20_30130 [Mycolicibacterium agri]|uniref:Uncharacterized protein n=1 Tax=Mycolicibacterium agri TaxID=36811 RepID=A0A2A7MP53_MYCAG|nr:hypothetical protein [Mycolicibacterium agri]PEG33572.1 hypothetical protein CQY20_30130 [Mycolicibacterium agri]GFG50779.1 hypothetical protein MAGR_22200 [Mycolicibacterium agri]
MARLPIPGKDSGTWGDVLNDYLSQAHKADGNLKDNSVTANVLAPNSVTNSAIASDAVTAASIADGSITEALLSSGVQTKLNAAGSGNVADDTILTAKLQDDAVTNDKIADGTIAEAKLATAVQTKLNQPAPTWSTLSGKPPQLCFVPVVDRYERRPAHHMVVKLLRVIAGVVPYLIGPEGAPAGDGGRIGY